MSQIAIEPNVEGPMTGHGRWMVEIFNNDTNSQEEVVEILMHATGCDIQEAFMEIWEAETYGKAAVHFAGQTECEEIAATISRIGVKTAVSLEWED